MYLALDRFLWKKSYLPLYLTQIIHSNRKMLFVWQKNCLSKFLWGATHVQLSFTSRKSSVFHSRRQVTFQNIPKTQSKQFHLRLYLTQIVNSNSKMLFLQLYNCLTKFLWCAAHVYFCFTPRKNSLFRKRQQVTCQMFTSPNYVCITFARTIL